MFISGNDYFEKLKELIAEADDLVCAVAFWGQGAETLLADRKTKEKKKTRIICNLRSGATNPDVVQELMKYAHVKQHDALHAKVIVGNGKAIVGSANFSCSGLNLEGSEQGGWQEAGIITENPDDIDRIGEWFEAIWEDSREISDADIELVRLFWRNRRENRLVVSQSSDKSLLDIPIAELQDRSIYLVITTGHFENEVNIAFDEICTRNQLNGQNMQGYACFEEFPEGILLGLHYSRGRLIFDGIYKVITSLSMTVELDNGATSYLQICNPVKIQQARFNDDDIHAFLKLVKPVIKNILQIVGKEPDEAPRKVIELWRAIEMAREPRTRTKNIRRKAV